MSTSKHVLCIILLMYLITNCVAVIYHLNGDEYDRMPPLFGLEAYEPCLRQADGVYCLLELELHEGSDSDLMSLIRGYSEHKVKHYNHSYIQRGVCVQKSCKKFIRNQPLNNVLVINRVLEECLNDSIWNEYGLEARVKSLKYCDTRDKVNKKDIGDWIVATMFFVIVIINFWGTMYDMILNKKNRPNGNKYLLSFSLLANWQSLVNTRPTDPAMERLKGLHGFKTVIICFMIIAHVMWINTMGFTENTHDFEKSYESTTHQLVFNGMMIIQIFFVQSGFLLMHKLLIRLESQTVSWKMYAQLVLMRWWRLTPPYVVVLAFTATWLRHLGSGPLWRLWVADSVVADCRTYWWLHLLYLNNYVSADRFCAAQTWYLGAEMQVFAVSLFLFVYSRSRGHWVKALAWLLLLGVVAPALHVWLQDLDAIVIMEPEFYRTKVSDTFDVHIMGHNYLTSYVSGMGAACVLFRHQKKGINKKKSKVLQLLSWCFFPAMCCLFLIGRGFYADGPRAHLALRAAWAAGHRLLLSGMAAFAILSIVLRFSESACAVFECPVLVVAGRLTYCVYLVHINFIHALLGHRASLTQVSLYNMIIVYLGIVVVSFIAALALYLLVEAPATRLMNSSLVDKRKQKPTPAN